MTNNNEPTGSYGGNDEWETVEHRGNSSGSNDAYSGLNSNDPNFISPQVLALMKQQERKQITKQQKKPKKAQIRNLQQFEGGSFGVFTPLEFKTKEKKEQQSEKPAKANPSRSTSAPRSDLYTASQCQELIDEQTQKYPDDITRRFEVLADLLGHDLLVLNIHTPQAITSVHKYQQFVEWPISKVPSNSLKPLTTLVDNLYKENKSELREAAQRILTQLITALNRSKDDLLSPGQKTSSALLGGLVMLQVLTQAIDYSALIPSLLESFISKQPSIPSQKKASKSEATKEPADSSLTQSERLLFWAHGQSNKTRAQNGVKLWARYLLPLVTSPNSLARHQHAHILVGFAFVTSFEMTTPTGLEWKEAMAAFTTSNPVSAILPTGKTQPQLDSQTVHLSSTLACVHQMSTKMIQKKHPDCASAAIRTAELCCALQRSNSVPDSGSMQRVLLEWIWTLMEMNMTSAVNQLIDLFRSGLEQTPNTIAGQKNKAKSFGEVGMVDGMVVMRWILMFIPYKVNELQSNTLFSKFGNEWYRLALTTAKWTEQVLDRIRQATKQNGESEHLKKIQTEAVLLLNTAKQLVIFCRESTGQKKMRKQKRPARDASDGIDFDKAIQDDLSEPDEDFLSQEAGDTNAKPKSKKRRFSFSARKRMPLGYRLALDILFIISLVLYHVNGPTWVKQQFVRGFNAIQDEPREKIVSIYGRAVEFVQPALKFQAKVMNSIPNRLKDPVKNVVEAGFGIQMKFRVIYSKYVDMGLDYLKTHVPPMIEKGRQTFRQLTEKKDEPVQTEQTPPKRTSPPPPVKESTPPSPPPPTNEEKQTNSKPLTQKERYKLMKEQQAARSKELVEDDGLCEKGKPCD